jgi:hypothetical protein
MKFLLSIPCQLIVVIFIAMSISSIIGEPLQPLTTALSVANAPKEQPAAAPAPQSFSIIPILVALGAAISTFLLWHLYRFYRSELAINQVKRAGGRVTTSNNLTGILRYIFGDVSVSFSDRRLPNHRLPELHQIHNLVKLDLSNSGVSQKSLAAIIYCRFLQEIDLRGNALTREELLKFTRKTTAKMMHGSPT